MKRSLNSHTHAVTGMAFICLSIAAFANGPQAPIDTRLHAPPTVVACVGELRVRQHFLTKSAPPTASPDAKRRKISVCNLESGTTCLLEPGRQRKRFHAAFPAQGFDDNKSLSNRRMFARLAAPKRLSAKLPE
jgi:hypothetical protein